MAHEGYHLVCVHGFDHHVTGKKYARGMMVTDPAEVKFLLDDKEHHFNRITATNVAIPSDEELAINDDNK